MARETKAAREEREQAELAARAAAQAAAWFPKVMSALEEATSGEYNMELSVHNGMFVLWDRDEEEAHELPVEYSANLAWRLEALEAELERKNEERARQRRLADARANALAKLTAEDREVLGL